MKTETIIDTEKMGLWLHPEEKIVRHEIKLAIFGDDFKQLLTKGADVFVENNCNKWLSNDQSNSTVHKEDLEWADKNWQPKVIDGGLKYWAIVLPTSVLGKLPMRSLIDRYEKLGVTVQTFDSADEGLAWLKSIDLQ